MTSIQQNDIRKDRIKDDVLLQSRVIAWLRFPLIVGVVLIHTNLMALVESWTGAMPQWPGWLAGIINFFSDVFTRCSVPMFFLFSGFLFFWNVKEFSVAVYFRKLKSRICTLLLPYIIWNTLALILFYVKAQPALEGLSDDSGKAFDLLKYLSGYWAFFYKNDCPADGPLWFLRDLMVVMLFAPLIYKLVRGRLGVLFVALLLLCWEGDFWVEFPGFSCISFFFFSLGAWMALNGCWPVYIPDVVGKCACCIYPALALFDLYMRGTHWSTKIYVVTILIEIVAVFYAVSIGIRRGKLVENRFLSESSFFIYAFHGLLIGVVAKLLYLGLSSEAPAVILFIYLLSPLVTIVVSIVFYSLLKNFLPKVASLLSGSRSTI